MYRRMHIYGRRVFYIIQNVTYVFVNLEQAEIVGKDQRDGDARELRVGFFFFWVGALGEGGVVGDGGEWGQDKMQGEKRVDGAGGDWRSVE